MNISIVFKGLSVKKVGNEQLFFLFEMLIKYVHMCYGTHYWYLMVYKAVYENV